MGIMGLYRHRYLIYVLTKNEVVKRYKGSYIGIGWSFLTPLMMLGIYTLVFGEILQARWSSQAGGAVKFALVIYCGQNIFTLVSEAVSRAPSLVVSNPHFVKKVIFPLEILPITIVGSALLNSILSFLVLGLFVGFSHGGLSWTFILLPIVLGPIVLFVLGLCWFFSSLGTYIRDIETVIPLALTGLLFLSPVFYPLSAVPAKLQFLFYLNPLTYPIEEVRGILLWGITPSWGNLLLEWFAGLITMIAGYTWFQKTKEGFADVL